MKLPTTTAKMKKKVTDQIRLLTFKLLMDREERKPILMTANHCKWIYVMEGHKVNVLLSVVLFSGASIFSLLCLW